MLLAQLAIFPYRSSYTRHIQTCIGPIELGLYWSYTPSRAGLIRENMAPVARAIRRINTSNIALPGKTILKLYYLEIYNVFIMIFLRYRVKYSLSPWAPPSGFSSCFILPSIPRLLIRQIQCRGETGQFRVKQGSIGGFWVIKGSKLILRMVCWKTRRGSPVENRPSTD